MSDVEWFCVLHGVVEGVCPDDGDDYEVVQKAAEEGEEVFEG